MSEDTNKLDSEMRKYELELYIFLNFYIKTALISIEYLKNEQMSELFEDKAQYYHYHILNLSTSMGLIHDRFIPAKYSRRHMKAILDQLKVNYNFSAKEYPNITNKNVRNFFQHINERNYWLIKSENIFTAFNTIDKNDKRSRIRKIKRYKYNSFFDIEALEYNYYDQKYDERFILNILEVEEELKVLNRRNLLMHKYLYGVYSNII